jgi:hypothetical protein
MSDLWNNLKPYLSSTGGKVGGVIVAAVGTVITAALTPLGDTLRDTLWPEKITVDQDVSLVEKSSVPLQLVITDASRGSALSGGRVKLQAPDDGAVILHGPNEFTFPAAAGSISVSPQDLSIEGRLPGKSQIRVWILTNRGRHFSGHVDVVTAATRAMPTNRDFSTGDWLIVLNGREGALTMNEEPSHRFAGTAKLEDGSTYSVKGWRDGEAFHADFRPPGQTGAQSIAYKADGYYCQKTDWLIVNAKVVTYRDGAPAPNPIPLQTISQRCPGFPDILKDVEGDGAFLATVATK